MRCAICGVDVQFGERSVLTRDGTSVHVACADREAARAWTQRRRWAMVHLLAVVLAISMLLLGGTCAWLLVLSGIGIVTHPLIHRRVWQYLARDIRTWLNRHGHG